MRDDTLFATVARTGEGVTHPPILLNSRVVLIRHGQTACTRQGRFCGDHDGELTRTGRQMARRTAEHPALAGVTRVVASPARRALGSAEALAAGLGLPVAVDDRLRELSFGEWEDRLPSELGDLHPLGRWQQDPALFAPPGGESGLQVLARAVAAVRDAAERDRVVAIVTHKAPIRLVLAFFLGFPPSRYREIGNIGVGSVTELVLRGRRAELRRVGDVSHLPEAWRADPDRVTAVEGPR
jgi:broad specificity phosphatase PhoE